MNTLLTAPSRHQHPPQQAVHHHPVRRVGLLDRIALRVGLALLVWARRPVRSTQLRYISQAELDNLREARYSSHRLMTMIH